MRWTAISGATVILLTGVSPIRALPSAADVLRLFDDLPERFLVEEASESDALSQAGGPGRIFRLRSVRPVRRTEAGALYARVSLSAWEMENAEAAKAEVRRQLAAADPDTGLSYAWDFVASRGESVLHFHGDCTVSEELFVQISARLREGRLVEGTSADESFTCRCGGGCRSDPPQPPLVEAPPALPRVRPSDPEWDQYDNRWDPSGAWESDIGRLSLMHHASGLSFTYLAVFGPTAHICEGAGVAGLVGTDRYEYGDEEGTVAFVISDRTVQLELTEGIASFCGAGWSGDTFSIDKHRPPAPCSVRAERAYFHVTDHVRPERRGAFVVRGDRVEAVPVELSGAGEMVLGRFVRPGTAAVGLLRADEIECEADE